MKITTHLLPFFLAYLCSTNAYMLADSLVDEVIDIETGQVGELCKTQLLEYIRNLAPDPENLVSYPEDLVLDPTSLLYDPAKFWALKMLDATSKIQTGFLSLNNGEMGNFQQCIDIEETEVSSGPIRGKYCLGSLQFNSTMTTMNKTHNQMTVQKMTKNILNLPKTNKFRGLSWAVCLPDACTHQDANHIINGVLDRLFNGSVSIVFPEDYCQTKGDVKRNLTAGAIVTLIFLCLMVLIMVISTAYDIFCTKSGTAPLYLIFVAFSVYTNGRKLLRKSEKKDGQITCLDGMRFLSMIWIIIGHQFSITLTGPLANPIDLFPYFDSIRSMFIVSAIFSVDTFFVIGGVLCSYCFLQAKAKGSNISIPTFYLHRFIRLTPALAAAVLVSSTLLVYMGSGPNWPMIKLHFQDNCVSYWWSTLLYIQNWVNLDKFCVGQTWYLCVDMQLYLISPMILIPLWRKPKLALAFVVLLILASMAISGYIAQKYELAAILSNIYGHSENFMNKYYLMTYTRANPWLTGLIMGYLVHKLGQRRFEIRQYINVLVSTISSVLLLFTIFIGHDQLRGPEYKLFGNVAHIVFVRPLWSIGICGIIFVCVTYPKGPINHLLSLPIFQVLNRFTYSIFLLHVTLLYMWNASKKTADYFSEINMVYEFWGTLWFTLGLSLFWILAFESPMITIEKIVFKKRPKPQSETQSTQDHIMLDQIVQPQESQGQV